MSVKAIQNAKHLCFCYNSDLFDWSAFSVAKVPFSSEMLHFCLLPLPWLLDVEVFKFVSVIGHFLVFSGIFCCAKLPSTDCVCVCAFPVFFPFFILCSSEAQW